MKRTWSLVPLALVFLAWVSCTTVKHLQLATAEKSVRSPDSLATLHVVGYTTADAYFHRFDGYVRFDQPDSIHFYNTTGANGFVSYRLSLAFALARSNVASLEVRQVKTLETIGTVVAVTTVVVVLVAALTHHEEKQAPPPQTTSCPLVYSWDGAQFVLDAEPYGGATIHALERTDVTELEHLASSNGRYRLLLTNEMEETQHTNRIELMVVDHASGVVVAPDLEGMPHGFTAVHRLVEARDQAGRDLLPWLVEKDQATWHPDLAAISKHLPLTDVRDHITLTFDRPAGVRNAYLLADVATSPWGASMIRPMLEMRGATLGLFYAAINANEGARRKLHEWNEREELFYLDVEVEEGGRWVRHGHVIGGGPVVAETRAIPLDLSRVTGDRVRVRLHPPIGYWMFNAFRLADAEAPIRVQTVAPQNAQDGEGRSVLASLIGDDNAYLTFATNEDRGVVSFPAPAQVRGMSRTVFARTRGWYEIRLHPLGFPDLAEIDRMTNRPGYPVQFALLKFRTSADNWLAQAAGEGRGSNVMSARN